MLPLDSGARQARTVHYERQGERRYQRGRAVYHRGY